MSKILWDQTGERLYETGVAQGVLYVQNDAGAYPAGVPWNGLSAVTESPEGAEASAIYADNMKYLNLISTEEFKATIEAYTYPEEFDACNGAEEIEVGVAIGQQGRKTFGFSYKTLIGNDVDDIDHGYKIHVVYGCKASPSEKGFQTVNDSPEAITLSWEVTTTPVTVAGFKPTATLEIDSTKVDPADLALIEKALYGDDVTDANLPLPDALLALISA